jgi:hypothetical protein
MDCLRAMSLHMVCPCWGLLYLMQLLHVPLAPQASYPRDGCYQLIGIGRKDEKLRCTGFSLMLEVQDSLKDFNTMHSSFSSLG